MRLAYSINALLRLALPLAVTFLLLATLCQLRTPELPELILGGERSQLLDRHGEPLTLSFEAWNYHQRLDLVQIPSRLIELILLAEDRHFYTHHGIDWLARLAALGQNLRAGRAVRGASTISEQVVRMLHPRPRTLWSRWLEGWEAIRLERRYDKATILGFYLNQLPYASNRRGVGQAAQFYFDRQLSTLNLEEQLALAVLIRSPSRFDLYRDAERLRPALGRLAEAAHQRGLISAEQLVHALAAALPLQRARLPLRADHFVRYLRQSGWVDGAVRWVTTLDGALQRQAEELLRQRLAQLRDKNVQQGALLLLDHRRGEILAWVSTSRNRDERWFDAVTTPRQPGSTLKPFLYALALEQGWTAATLIEDSPLVDKVGTGLHRYRNYSQRYYGPLRLREALGNSLNIPALRTIRHVGVEPFLQRLHQLGISSLRQSADYYGDGLALGSGEISLLELVGAYATLANGGLYHLPSLLRERPSVSSERVYSAPVSRLIGNILSDPAARRREFGYASLLRFPTQTAVKTGTSSDFNDAWTFAFNHRYTVGVWMGNLDGSPMRNISGSKGPAWVARSLFALLEREAEGEPLLLDPQLVQRPICLESGALADGHCRQGEEWFVAGNEPSPVAAATQLTRREPLLRIEQPIEALRLALDPRQPAEFQAFRFRLNRLPEQARVRWYLNDQLLATTQGDHYDWPLQRGEFRLRVELEEGVSVQRSEEVRYRVF